jgi:hypothetical protein
MSQFGLDWKNLDNSPLQALQYACQQLRIRPVGSLKNDYVSALQTYRAALPSCWDEVKDLDLLFLTSPRGRCTGLADLERKNTRERTRKSQLLAQKLLSATASPQLTPPQLIQTRRDLLPSEELQTDEGDFDDSRSPERELIEHRSSPPAPSISRCRSPRARTPNTAVNFGMYLTLAKYAAILGILMLLVIVTIIAR